MAKSARLFLLFLFVSALGLSSAEPRRRSRNSGRFASDSAAAALPDGESKRQQRYLSLFNVVQFKQEQCTTESDTTMRGTCMTTNECDDNGGTSDGNCAAGFGVCCMFTSTCSSSSTTNTISRNCTYLQNNGYPSSMSGSTTCNYNFDRVCENLCQIRLDFDNLVTAAPPQIGVNVGSCPTSGDTVQATTPTGRVMPIVCGTLTGQHMFMETGASGGAGSLAITFGTATGATRTFKIKVTYYACDSLNKAPADCIQYFTGASGTIKSYNFDGGRALTTQRYSNCVRQEEGFCSISYSTSATTTPDPFLLVGNTVGTAETAAETTVCTSAYITIPGGASPSGRYCGSVLNNIDAETLPAAIVSNVTPFRLDTFFNTAVGTAATVAAIAATGYSIDYSQVAC